MTDAPRFRVWLPEPRKMFNPRTLFQSADGLRVSSVMTETGEKLVPDPTAAILMQATGALDDQGHPIYDGDIVSYARRIPLAHEDGWGNELPKPVGWVQQYQTDDYHALVFYVPERAEFRVRDHILNTRSFWELNGGGYGVAGSLRVIGNCYESVALMDANGRVLPPGTRPRFS